MVSFLCAIPLLGQSGADLGQIIGVVTDPDQAVISAAHVTLTSQQTKMKATVVTDAQGAYAFRSLPSGNYLIEADASGFKPSISMEIRVAAGQSVTLDIALTLAGIAQSVTVSAGTVENAYRVDNVQAGGPLGATPIQNIP